MKVKITDCSGAGYWYRNKIDQIFDVEPEYYLSLGKDMRKELKCYKVKGTIKTISLKDCKVITSSTKSK